MSKIIFSQVNYKYPLSDEPVLKDITFKIEAGDFIGIVGRNEAGKSTLAKTFVGLVPQFYHGKFSGEVSIDGINLKNQEIAAISQKVGLVFQNPFNQISGAKLTVSEEIAFGLENIGLAKDEMVARIEYYLKSLDIYQFKDRNPFDLSGGQMQRLAIASIMALKPEILVLDEPTSQLDPQGTEEVFQAVHRLSQNGITVIMVSHKIEKLAQYADKIMLLDNGRIIDYAPTEEIFSRNDLAKYGVRPPVYTSIARELGLKDDRGLLPTTLEDIYQLVVYKYGINLG